MTSFKDKLKQAINTSIRYFLQGLLLMAPLFVTFYAVFYFFNLFDTKANDAFFFLFGFRFPGLGILVMYVVISLIGLVGSTILVQPLLDGVESLLSRAPVVKDIYGSIRDFISAFLSNKKKFNKPVVVEMGKGLGIYKIGFVTDQDLQEFDITDKVAVYFPHSYNFSGNLFLVNIEQVKPINNQKSADIMKYIVSGGVMEMDEHQEIKK
jgi:uncharacterized membrane protein